MSAHAAYSPSKLPNLALCLGWKSDPTPGPMALRGTEIHGCLAAYVGDALDLKAIRPEVAEPVAAGIALFEDLRSRFPDHHWQAEVRLDAGIPEVFGTADVVGVSDWSPVGVVIDWKSGRGERDDSGASLQTAAYAIGLMRVYPHLQEIVVFLAELEQTPTETLWLRADLEAAAERIRNITAAVEASGDDPQAFTPSAKACQYCARREDCPALRANVEDTAAIIAGNGPGTVLALSPQEVAASLTRFRPAAKLVADFIDALEDRAKALITAGTPVPGYAIKESNGARGWTAPEDVVRRELAAHGADLSTIVSPTEAEKRLAEKLGGKKKAADAIKGLCAPSKRKSLVEE